MNIPVVDLSDFLSGDESRKKKFVNDLGRAYEEVGFVLKNYKVFSIGCNGTIAYFFTLLITISSSIFTRLL